jgi:hypothetical protein
MACPLWHPNTHPTIPLVPQQPAQPGPGSHGVRCRWQHCNLAVGRLPPLALYVHLPWCLKKCPYCDFNSHEWRGAGSMPEQAYLDAVVADLEAALAWSGGARCTASSSAAARPACFRRRRSTACWATSGPGCAGADCEVTLEANPGTFERNRFKAFRSAGVTRLSVGVQSFNDAHLKALGRVHDRAQALAAVEEAAQAFDTFNLDLMYALPGQTLASCAADLATALALAPPHLSIYHLTIEPNTYFAKFPPVVPDDDMPTPCWTASRLTQAARAAALRGVGLCPARPPLLAQPQLLAVWRLPGHWCRRAQQAQLLPTAWCARCVSASPACTWSARWRAGRDAGRRGGPRRSAV